MKKQFLNRNSNNKIKLTKMRKKNIHGMKSYRKVNNSRTQILYKRKLNLRRKKTKNHSNKNPNSFDRCFSGRKNPFFDENIIRISPLDDYERYDNTIQDSENRVNNEHFSGSDDNFSYFDDMEQERIREDKENGYKLVFSKNHGNLPPRKPPSSKSSVSDSIINPNTTDILPLPSDDEKEILNILKNRKDLSNLKDTENSTTKKIFEHKLRTQKISKSLSTPKTNVPWVSDKTIESRGIVKLHYEILDFFQLIKATDEENNLRVKTFNMFNKLIKNKWPNWNVELFGSFPNNIHLPDSDIDVAVLKENITSLNNFNSYIKDSVISEGGQLNLIYREILKGFVDEIRYVDAKVPIIKIKCKETQVRMDISANRDNGYKAVSNFQKILAKYPFIRPIVLLLKFILRQRNLNETFTGGVSSYLLLNMSYAYVLYIQMQGDDIDESLKPENLNLGSFLKGFLKFYSEEFNWRDLGISIRNGLQFFSKWTRNFSSNENLCFENFQEPDKDIGRGAYQFPCVVKIFREILFKLHKAKFPSNQSYLSMFITITLDLKRRKLNLLERESVTRESI